jgi:hypothetical protein
MMASWSILDRRSPPWASVSEEGGIAQRVTYDDGIAR